MYVTAREIVTVTVTGVADGTMDIRDDEDSNRRAQEHWRNDTIT